MIQRIQSIFLLVVAICMGATAALPYWKEIKSPKTAGETEIHIGELNSLELTHVVKTSTDAKGKIKESMNTVSILVLCLVASAVSIYVLFQYNNRMRQVKLSALNTLFIGGSAAAMMYYSYVGEEWINPQAQGTLLIGFYLPLVAIVFNMLSRHFIMKDEKLVRSADRIR